MTVHGIGACMLLSFMRLERRAELDSDWMLYGAEVEEPREIEMPEPWRWAAE